MNSALCKFRPLLVSVGFISLCGLFYFLRGPSITLEPVLYAEDGSIFLQSAIDSGFASLFKTYAGYSHLLQRFVALLAVNYISPLEYPRFFLAVAWVSYLLPLACMEMLIHERFFGRILRVSYVPYVVYPYAAETYLNLPNAYIFFPLGFILIAYGVYGRRLEHSKVPPLRLRPCFQLLLFFYGVVAVLTGPFAALYTLPLLICVAIRRRCLPWRPIWLTVPVLLSPIQLYLSQLKYSYPVTTPQALGKLLARPDVLLDWFTIHMVSPLYGGYIAGRYLRAMQQPLKVLILFAMVAVVVLAVRVVAHCIKNQLLLYLPIVSTIALSFSSLLITLRRGEPLSHLVIEDGGGRFFFWNTVLFLAILLTALVLVFSNRLTHQKPAAIAMTAWLIAAIVLYHNNISARSVEPSYSVQLALQCLPKESTHKKIEVFAGPQWAFNLAKPQIEKLCTGPLRGLPLNVNPSDLQTMSSIPRPLDTGRTETFVLMSGYDALIDSVGLKIGTYNRVNHGELSLCIESSRSGNKSCSKGVKKSEMYDNQIIYFPFIDSFTVRDGEQVILSIKDNTFPVNRSKEVVALYISDVLNSPVVYAGINFH